MASTRDKNRARALMRANPDLNYTAALRQVQADRDTADRPHAETTEIVLDEAYDLTQPSQSSPAAREAIARALAAAEAPTLSLGDLPPGSLDPFAFLKQDAPAEEEAGAPGSSPVADDPNLHAVANDPTLDEGTRKAARDLLQADRDTVGPHWRGHVVGESNEVPVDPQAWENIPPPRDDTGSVAREPNRSQHGAQTSSDPSGGPLGARRVVIQDMEEIRALAQRLGARPFLTDPQQSVTYYDPLALTEQSSTDRTETGLGKSVAMLRMVARESRARGLGSVGDDPHQPDAAVDLQGGPEGSPEE